jgi:hypothetical protein
MSFVKNLEVMLSLSRNDSVLHTQRLQSSPLTVFFGNLAGSIVGLLGMIQFFMNFIEEKFEIYLNCKERKTNFKQLKEKRREIVDKNFTLDETFNKNTEPLDTGRDFLAYNNISVLSEHTSISHSRKPKQEHTHSSSVIL